MQHHWVDMLNIHHALRNSLSYSYFFGLFCLKNLCHNKNIQIQTGVLAGDDDVRTADGINCTFLRDLRIVTASDNKQSLEDLLRGFFEFYDKFSFKERGLSIVRGDDFVKPEHSALYIQVCVEASFSFVMYRNEYFSKYRVFWPLIMKFIYSIYLVSSVFICLLFSYMMYFVELVC